MSLLSKYWKVVFFTDNIYINLLLPLVYNGNIMMTNDFILDLGIKRFENTWFSSQSCRMMAL